MSEEDEVIQIRLTLRGKVKDRFLALKDFKGLTNDTEVCRLIISEYFALRHIISEYFGERFLGEPSHGSSA